MSQRVEGHGRRPARVAFVGEAPAKHELQEGFGFAGPSGGVLWPMVWRECGLSREYCWVTNLVKIELEEKWQKTKIPADVLAEYGDELEWELSGVEPEIVVAVGRYAIRHFLGEWANVETCNARVWEVERPWGTVKVIGMMHPAAAMRDSGQLNWTAEAVKVLRAVLAGGGPVPVPLRHDIRVFDDFDEYLTAIEHTPVGTAGLDTEWTTDGKPWGLSFAVDPHTALVLRAEDKHGLKCLRSLLERARPRVAMHYALADLEPLRRMGLDIREMGLEIVDTNIQAFIAETEPKGLKALCRRHLGLAMRDYEDVVGPYFRAELERYLAGVFAMTQPAVIERYGKPTKKQLAAGETRGKRLKDEYEPASKLHSRVKRALNDLGKDDETDLSTRWGNWPDELKAEARALCGVAPEKDLRLVPKEEAEQYAGEDAAGTIGALQVLEAMERSPVIEDMTHRVLPMVDDMQRVGLEVDLSAHAVLKAYIDDEIAEARELLCYATGRDDFNPDSPDQVREVLFGLKKVKGLGELTLEHLNDDGDYVAPIKYTKTGLPQADKKTLSLLIADHTLPPLLLHYRMLAKLKSTYVDPLPGFLRGGVLHPRYSITRVPSGRLAASDPNIMAIPKRGPLAKKMRALFRARAGRLFGAWDHGQIELRVMADDARDAAMIRELLPGAADMHRANAKLFFGLDGDVFDDAYWVKGGAADRARECSKVITYGIAYGAEAPRLHFEALVAGFDSYGVDDFFRFRNEWFRKYAGVREMTEETARLAKRDGYITDRWGRRRKLAAAAINGNRWPYNKMREEAIRQGQNHRIQGGAQGLMQRAMIRVQEEVLPALRAMGWSIDMLLQVHDELIAEFETAAWEIVNAMMTWAMVADSDLLACGIVTDSAKGLTWADL